MTEYRPTEYVVDFGDNRSSKFVSLSMALIERNGAKLNERIVRCRDCRYATDRWSAYHGDNVTYCERFVHLAGYNQSAYVEPNGFCAWGERRDA